MNVPLPTKVPQREMYHRWTQKVGVSQHVPLCDGPWYYAGVNIASNNMAK